MGAIAYGDGGYGIPRVAPYDEIYDAIRGGRQALAGARDYFFQGQGQAAPSAAVLPPPYATPPPLAPTEAAMMPPPYAQPTMPSPVPVDMGTGTGAPAGTGPSGTGGPPPGESPDVYESMVRDYMTSLGSAPDLPRPPALTRTQALAVTLNPDKSDQLLRYFREPYERDVAAFQMHENRRGRAAEMASRELDRRDARLERTQNRNYLREQVMANAGVDYPYSNPELKAFADSRRRDFNTVHQGEVERDARQTHQDRMQETRRVEDDIRSLDSQIGYMATSLQNAPGAAGTLNPIMSRAQQHAADLRTYRELLDRFSDQDFSDFQALSPDQRAEFLRRYRQRSMGVGPQAALSP